MPEYAISPNELFEFYADTVKRGQQVSLATAFSNLSTQNGEPILLEYRLVNELGTSQLNSKLITLNPKELHFDSIKISTDNLSGRHTLLVEINPKDSLWKLEKHAFNNQLRTSFFVEADNLNPLLDITFDGIRILDGDIVLPNAIISATLKDDNPFLALDIASNLSLWIEDPLGNRMRLNYNPNSEQYLEFFPATLPKNKAEVRFRGDFKQDGVYKLIAQGTDASGNPSGSSNYSIQFEVISKHHYTGIELS